MAGADGAFRRQWCFIQASMNQHAGEPVRLGVGDTADDGGEKQAVFEREAEQV